MSTDVEVLTSRRSQIFDHLVENGQWERVLEMGPQLLSQDPENAGVHGSMAVASLQLDRLKLARFHAEAVERIEPEDAWSHQLMARVWQRENRPLNAKRELLEALRLRPEDSGILLEYGWNCYQRGDFKSALIAAEEARKLTPENADIENLFAAAQSEEEDNGTRLDAFAQIEAFENALRLEPENAEVMHNIGLTYLDRLDDAENAEEWFRKAARINPLDPDHRKGLHRSLLRRDPVLRILNFPIHAGRKLSRKGQEWYEKKWPLILALPVIPVAIALGGAVLALWAVFLFLPAKVYESLTVQELLQKAGGIREVRRGIHGAPFWIRFGGFLVFFGAFISGLYWVLTHPDLKSIIGDILGWGMAFFFIGLLWWSAKRTN